MEDYTPDLVFLCKHDSFSVYNENAAPWPLYLRCRDCGQRVQRVWHQAVYDDSMMVWPLYETFYEKEE